MKIFISQFNICTEENSELQKQQTDLRTDLDTARESLSDLRVDTYKHVI